MSKPRRISYRSKDNLWGAVVAGCSRRSDRGKVKGGRSARESISISTFGPHVQLLLP